MNASGQLGLMLKAAWVVVTIATVLMALFFALATALYFDMSYGQPPDSYTGQDWARAASWLMLTLSMGAIALAALTSYIPARLRRLLARAHAANSPLLARLGA